MDAITLEQLEATYETRPYKQNNNSTNLVGTLKTARSQALYDTALSIGIKGGMASQFYKISNTLKSRTNYLDKVYNFEPYLIYSRVVPPVITEAKNLYNQDGDDAVRLSGALYKIERKARIVSVAPNWREYLNFPMASNVLNISTSINPLNNEEKDLWKKAMHRGWGDGIEQSNLMFTQSLDRLNRDFLGILRFHRFVEEGKVTLPVLAASKMDFTKNTSSLILNEELLRLTIQPDFANPDGWKVKIAAHHLKTKNYQIFKENKEKDNNALKNKIKNTKKDMDER